MRKKNAMNKPKRRQINEWSEHWTISKISCSFDGVLLVAHVIVFRNPVYTEKETTLAIQCDVC